MIESLHVLYLLHMQLFLSKQVEPKRRPDFVPHSYPSEVNVCVHIRGLVKNLETKGRNIEFWLVTRLHILPPTYCYRHMGLLYGVYVVRRCSLLH